MRALGAGLSLLVALLCGCGGGSEPVPAPSDVARDVRRVFEAYTAAMGEQRFGSACAHLAPESVGRLRADVDELVPDPPRECPELLQLIYDRTTPTERRELRQISETVRVEGVFASERDDAVHVTWAAVVDGRRVPIQQPVRRVGGEWKLVGAR